MPLRSGGKKTKMTILDELAESARDRVKNAQRIINFSDMRILAEDMAKITKRDSFSFEKVLASPGKLSLICEVKKASPSKGIIAEQFPYKTIATEYEQAGADAISVLTEPTRFLGSDKYLSEIAHAVSIPVLRKDFTVDEYQIYEAKHLGAAAVLLICSLLEKEQLREYINVGGSLGLSSLVEIHSESEAEMALEAGAKIVGVNNRNLRTFDVDTNLSVRLRQYIPPEVIYVSESGLKTPEDAAMAWANGADAALIGEALMRTPDKYGFIASIRDAARDNN